MSLSAVQPNMPRSGMDPMMMAMVSQQQGIPMAGQQANPFGMGGQAAPTSGFSSTGSAEIDDLLAQTNLLSDQGTQLSTQIGQMDATFSQKNAEIDRLKKENQAMQVAMATGQGANPSMFAGGAGGGGSPNTFGGSSTVDVANSDGDPVQIVKGLAMDASSEAKGIMAQMETASVQHQIKQAQIKQLEMNGIDPDSLQGKQILHSMDAQNGAAVALQTGRILQQQHPQIMQQGVPQGAVAGGVPMQFPTPQGVDAARMAQYGIDPSLMVDPSMVERGGGMLPPPPQMSVPSPEQYMSPQRTPVLPVLEPPPEQTFVHGGVEYPFSLLVSLQSKLGGRAQLEALLEAGTISESQFNAATGSQDFKGADLRELSQAAVAQQAQMQQAQMQQAQMQQPRSANGGGDTLTADEQMAVRIQRSRARMKSIGKDFGGSAEDLSGASAFSRMAGPSDSGS